MEKPITSPPESPFDEELDQLELRIAQRADELARARSDATPALEAWHQAENEIWTARLGEIEAVLAR